MLLVLFISPLHIGKRQTGQFNAIQLGYLNGFSIVRGGNELCDSEKKREIPKIYAVNYADCLQRAMH